MGIDLEQGKRPKANTTCNKFKYKRGVVVRFPNEFVSGLVGDRPRMVEYVEQERGSEYTVTTVRLYIYEEDLPDNEDTMVMAADIFAERLEKFNCGTKNPDNTAQLQYLLEVIEGQLGDEGMATMHTLLCERIEEGAWPKSGE